MNFDSQPVGAGSPCELTRLGVSRLNSGIVVALAIAGCVAFVILVVAVAGRPPSRRRYRPGRPFDFTPLWIGSTPEETGGYGHRDATGGASGWW